MKRFYTLIIYMLMLAGVAHLQASAWMPDSLGEGFEMRYVEQPADYAGAERCTIVRRLAGAGRGVGVLYVHGFNDYFFQREMALEFVSRGYDFYAVDLRRYGRSLMPGQTPFDVRDMREYFADIDSAMMQMRADGMRDVVLMGHSTGGLTTAYYMDVHPSPDVRVLVLNSPFLDWNQSAFQEKILVPIVDVFHKAFPNLKINQGDDTTYSHSLLKAFGGEWEYNVEWKRPVSPPVTTSWIAAIDAAQAVLQADPHIMVPILLMHSDHTFAKGDAPSLAARSDVVLDVADISRIGRRLGPDVTEITVHGGLHDLALSAPEIRQALYDYLFAYLSRYFPE